VGYQRTLFAVLVLGCAALAATWPFGDGRAPPHDASRNADARSAHSDTIVPASATPPRTDDRASAPPRNPYTGDPAAIAAGRALFAAKACSACHGADGGGGMCPPVTNDTWVYGSDDATLFDLLRLGSVALRERGRLRIGREARVGDMPPLAGVLSDDEAWQVLAYVRSKYAGDPALKDW